MTTATAGDRRLYETIFIAPPTLGEAEVERLVTTVTEALASKGAEVRLVERWGRRKLAYPVKRHLEGWYVLLHVAGDGAAVAEAERRMRIHDDVLKYLSVRIDNVPGAQEASVARLARRAKQEEERAQRAAERAAAGAAPGGDDDERARPRRRPDDDSAEDDDGEDWSRRS